MLIIFSILIEKMYEEQIKLVSINEIELKNLDLKYRKIDEIVLTAVKKNGCALKFADESHKKTKK